MKNLPIRPHHKYLEQRPDFEYIAAPVTENTQENALHNYLNVLKRRKWMVIVPFFIITVISILTTTMESPTYNATTTILIDDINPKIAPVQELITPDNSPYFFFTQHALIKSRAIVGKVVERLHLDEKPPQKPSPVKQAIQAIQLFPQRLLKWITSTLQGLLAMTPVTAGSANTITDPAEHRRQEAITRLQGSVQVVPREGTKLVDITLNGPDPVAVVEQVNTLAEIYIQENLATQLDASHKAIAWLQQETASLRNKTDQAQSTLQRFRAGKDFLPASTDTSGQRQNTATSLQRLDRLNASYVETNTARLQLQTQIGELKKLSNKSAEEILKFPGIERNPFLSTLKSKYLALQLEQANLSQKFKDKHPRLIQIKADMEETLRTTGTEIQNMISQLEKEYNTTLAKEGMLSKELGGQKSEIYGFSDDIKQYYTIQRDLDIDQNLFLAVSKRLAEATLTEALMPNNIRIIERALESVPVLWRPLVLVLNVILGLGFGVGLAFVSEYLDKHFKTADEVEQSLELPCLGVIPHYRSARRSMKPITLHDPRSNVAEVYRTIRTWIQTSAPQPVKSLLVTSAMPTEGKSTTAANLAVSFAQLGQRVLLVDGDLRRPMLHRIFGLTNSDGLTDILVRGVDWRQVLQGTDLENLQILSAGFTPSNPVELLSTQRMKAFTTQIKHAFDLVIFDAPMVLSLPDVVTLAPIMDGVLLVHSSVHGDKSSLVQAKRLLERLGASLVGVVLNDVSKKDVEYYTRYRYKSGSPRPANAPALIDMRPVEGGESWMLDTPDASNGAGALPVPINKTARSGGFAITILEMFLQPHIAEAESDPGCHFLVLDAVLVNEAEFSYRFNPGQTAIVIDAQNEYSRALTSLIEMPSSSGAGGSPPRGIRVYKYDPLTTSKLEGGIAGQETIAATNVKRGLLVYRVPLDADNYSFEYEHEEISITLPLRTS